MAWKTNENIKKNKYQNSFKGALQHDKRILTTVA